MARFTPKLGPGQTQNESKKLEIGWMGIIFGDASEKPGNIAALAIVLAFALLVVLFFVPDTTSGPKAQAMTLLGSVITGALGFLFGRRTQ